MAISTLDILLGVVALIAVVLRMLQPDQFDDLASRTQPPPFRSDLLQHTVHRLRRIPLSSLRGGNATALLAPFIATGLCEPVAADDDAPRHMWRGCDPESWSIAAMRQSFAHAGVEWYAGGMHERAKLERPARVPLATALDGIVASASGGAPTVGIAHWNLEAAQWAALVSRLPPLPLSLSRSDDALAPLLNPSAEDDFLLFHHWRMLIVGADGAGMFNHVDDFPGGSWQLQLRGRKRWHLCAPTQASFIERPMAGGGHVGVDLLRAPDYAAFPVARGADCFVDVVDAGEVIYYPPGWYHQTLHTAMCPDDQSGDACTNAEEGSRRGLGDVSVALSETTVPWTDATAVEAARTAVSRACTKPIPPHLAPSTCEALPALFEAWMSYANDGRDDKPAAA